MRATYGGRLSPLIFGATCPYCVCVRKPTRIVMLVNHLSVCLSVQALAYVHLQLCVRKTQGFLQYFPSCRKEDFFVASVNSCFILSSAYSRWAFGVPASHERFARSIADYCEHRQFGLLPAYLSCISNCSAKCCQVLLR